MVSSTSVGRGGRLLRPHRVAPRLAWHAVMALLALGVLVPLVWMISTSLRTQSSVFDGRFLPDSIVFDGYVRAWGDLGIWRNLLNSVVITAVSVVVIILTSTLAGYSFARIRFRGSSVAFGVIISALFVPAVATLIPVYIELKQFRLLGTQTGLLLVYVAGGLAFSVYLMRTFFDAVPRELSEAARIDGADEWQIFRRVMVPLAMPGVATIAIFQMISVWNELLLASALISDRALQPLQPAANSLVGEFGSDYPGLTAAMTISIVPMVVVYVVFQRWFVRGLTAGAIK